MRILGFVVQAASESEAWLNVLQYAIPISAAAIALRGVFRGPEARRRMPGGGAAAPAAA